MRCSCLTTIGFELVVKGPTHDAEDMFEETRASGVIQGVRQVRGGKNGNGPWGLRTW